MVQPSSGDSLEFRSLETGMWTPIEHMRFEEAKNYQWRTTYTMPFGFRLNDMPLPMVQTEYGWEGEWMSPFQSGLMTFTIEQVERTTLQTYIYPDERKLSESEYQQMITDILAEAAACFQHSGANLKFDSSGFQRRVSIAQWDYIDRSFHQLQRLFRGIQAEPVRRLKKTDRWVRRENVKHVTTSLLAWSERHTGSGMSKEIPIPSLIWTGVQEDSYNVYENQVMLRQLHDLQRLLRQYQSSTHEVIRPKATNYYERISCWLRSSYLQHVKPHAGPSVISQVFRKHPIYRNWFTWFQQLYQFKEFSIGMKSSIPLKDTYHLYEIWVFMQMVRLFRENEVLLDAADLFSLDQDGLVLKLSEKKESRIHLVGGATFAYQRWFTSAIQEYVTYTHGMKPDIVLEVKGKLYIFDPKYRLDHNLPMALGEMHKYRDGIVCKSDGGRAVEEVYIVTPAVGNESAKFFKDEYHQQYQMGAYCMKPGDNNQCLEKKLLSLVGNKPD